MNYLMQRKWSDLHMPKVKAAIADAIFKPADDHLDMKQATDLVFISPTGFPNLHIAVRLRKHTYFERFRNEFTVRCQTRTNCETELSKIMQGRGDLMFYAFLNEQETDFLKYTIGDLQVFREWYRDRQAFGGLPASTTNKDGTGFLPVKIHDLPDNFVVAVGGSEVNTTAATNDAADYYAGMPDSFWF
jgi:hypothetical protein